MYVYYSTLSSKNIYAPTICNTVIQYSKVKLLTFDLSEIEQLLFSVLMFCHSNLIYFFFIILNTIVELPKIEISIIKYFLLHFPVCEVYNILQTKLSLDNEIKCVNKR